MILSACCFKLSEDGTYEPLTKLFCDCSVNFLTVNEPVYKKVRFHAGN
ncbi:unnamed protein product [Schistosoma mattheei]|uniref:Uncharacterized protein n=1 Tax=Schistosoma mattheei TaxID=31246 RepID=A0A183PG59_9TREM|nr:unnamed protein product [Schistosoma mattheei]